MTDETGGKPLTMREKMARALCLEDGYDPDDDGGVPGVARWRSYLGGVDAVLSALEEPTEAMEDAGLEVYDDGDGWDSIYKAMIRAAKD